jgi:hypothetical protein
MTKLGWKTEENQRSILMTGSLKLVKGGDKYPAVAVNIKAWVAAVQTGGQEI